VTLRARERLEVLQDGPALTRAARALVLEVASEALAARGAFHLALSGGSTPQPTHAALAASAADFARWHAWFADERCVPPDDPASNHRAAAASGLLACLVPEHVHRMRGEAEPAAEARRHAAELCAALGEPPRLDLVVLGLGADGHTASLFPGTRALDSADWTAVGHAPTAPRTRITLTLPTLREARRVLFLVTGAEKADTLRAALHGSPDVPARAIHPHTGELVWLVDRAAAARLENER
jgi:6-phosphogluconolactonase